MDFKFSQIRLLVSNFKACFLFYRDVMGFQVTYGAPDDAYADFNTGSAFLAIFIRNGMSDAIGTTHLPFETPAQDRVCVVFEVDDVDATCQLLAEKGVQLVAPPMNRVDWGVRTAHFRDPDGNLIEINQGLPPTT